MVIMEPLKKKMKNHGKISLNIILPLNFKFKTSIRNYLFAMRFYVLFTLEDFAFGGLLRISYVIQMWIIFERLKIS